MVELKFRTWKVFADQTKFNKPDGKQYQSRLSSNLVYFAANYLAVVAVAALIICWLRPLFLLALALCGGSGYYLFFLRKTPIVIQTRVVTRQQTLAVFAVVSGCLFLLCGGFTSLIVLCIAVAAILVHASFRIRQRTGGNTFVMDLLRGGMGGVGGKQKSLDEEDADDDVRRPEDIENPGAGGAGGDPRDDDAQELQQKQAEFRSAFRERMRSKYLKKS